MSRTFSKNLQVGWKNRGMGHGDFGVIGTNGALVAEVKGSCWSGKNGEKLRLLPERRNAFLFAAAPDLYMACRAALKALKGAGGHAEEIKILQAAIKKTHPPRRMKQK